jgi:hypothetical protein
MKILLTIIALAALITAGYSISRWAVRKEVRDNAMVECKDGIKWIRDRQNNLIKWVNADGSSPTCTK